MDDKLQNEVAIAVDKIFAAKKDEDVRKRTEDALSTAAAEIKDLKGEVAKKDKAIKADAHAASKVIKDVTDEKDTALASVADKDEEIASLKKDVETKDNKVGVLETELSTKADELDSIRKDTEAVVRMAELEKAGVQREEKDLQQEKVKEMTDEEFATYKTELVSIRESIMAKLDVDEAEVGGVKTPPADTKKKEEAALNLEADTKTDLDKYDDLGKSFLEVAMTTDK